jgi:hypothetical protein
VYTRSIEFFVFATKISLIPGKGAVLSVAIKRVRVGLNYIIPSADSVAASYQHLTHLDEFALSYQYVAFDFGKISSRSYTSR